MESILARALEYTLKYWLKSFSRDQFKLQGRVVQLSNLDINGDALHASVGLPPALNVTAAKVAKLEIKLPYVSNVQTEPIVVQIDRLDLVLEENLDSDAGERPMSNQASPSTGKGSGYGFADKIADGMTLEVRTVNLLLETRGGARSQGGATWASPLASVTIHNLVLFTTNENWQVVNLKEARDFSNNTKCIYVFKKLEWGSLSVDLLPHPDMFTDADMTSFKNGDNKRDDDGAKRIFFGGERFLEGISGEAYITVQRTEQNCPLGLEVQLHVSEAVCPALSEPGLRALLRFMTGLYICLNRGDVDPKAQQRSTEAAGRSLVSIIVDHIFFCIKDSEFQLELLMQSLFFSRASVSDGENTKILSRIMIAGLFLRDTFSYPSCTLVQPSMQSVTGKSVNVPEFGENFCPPIYPLGEQEWNLNQSLPLICFHSLQMKPSPSPPLFASQTVINCQPLMVNLQEESCLRIASFLADGIVVNPGAVLPDFSINSIGFTLEEFDLIVPLTAREINNCAENGDISFKNNFSGARLHVEDLFISQSSSLTLKLLNLEKDPVCFCLWEGQPVDASQKKWTTCASLISLSLETSNKMVESMSFPNWNDGLWKCVELHEACIEASMVTADGNPLTVLPPPGGIVRIGIACQQFLSNTSVEQLFFVLDLYAYFGSVSEEISKVGRRKSKTRESLGGSFKDKMPSDTAVNLIVNYLQLKFVESSSSNFQGMPLAQFVGENLSVKVRHRSLGGAIAVSSNLHWESVRIDSVDTDRTADYKNGINLRDECVSVSVNGYPQMRSVFWIDNRNSNLNGISVTVPVPFLEISSVNVIPYDAKDMEFQNLNVSAKVEGVRLGGGMNYSEALLHRFSILGPDGGPGEGLSKGLKYLSAGPLSKIFKASSLTDFDEEEDGLSHGGQSRGMLELGRLDNVDLSIELKDWLFALEGAEDIAEGLSYNSTEISREEKCWHTSFQSLQVRAKSPPKHVVSDGEDFHKMLKYPFEHLTVSVNGLQAMKPRTSSRILQTGVPSGCINQVNSFDGRPDGTAETCGGVNLEVRMVIFEDENMGMAKWEVENVKLSVKQPFEAFVTKVELEQVALLFRSEVDSMGRITVGILRLLKLEDSLGQAAIDRLSNLGSEGLDRILSPEKLSRRSSLNSMGFSPFSNASPCQNLEATVTSMEAALTDSHARCSALVTEFNQPELSIHLEAIEQLNQKLESMQTLLTRLRTQI